MGSSIGVAVLSVEELGAGRRAMLWRSGREERKAFRGNSTNRY